MPEALDSGIVVLKVKKNNINNGSSNFKEECTKVSTVNILQMENFTAENEKLKESI